MIATAQIAPAVDSEETRRIVAHQFYHSLHAQLTLVDKLQHTHQRELHHRHTRLRLGRAALLLLKEMGRVVGADSEDKTRGQGLTQGLAVGRCLDGRIALDEGSQPVIVALIEEQMSQHSLASDLRELVGDRPVEQRQLARRRDMGDVQSRAIALGQFNGKAAAGHAGSDRPDEWMKPHRRILTVTCHHACHVTVDDAAVFAMRHQRQAQPCRLGEYLAQRLHSVYQHVARAGAHEELDAGYAMLI